MDKEEKIKLKDESEKVGLVISRDAFWYLATKCQPQPKGAPKHLKRLIRIRLNLFRELASLNKELRRHNIK